MKKIKICTTLHNYLPYMPYELIPFIDTFFANITGRVEIEILDSPPAETLTRTHEYADKFCLVLFFFLLLGYSLVSLIRGPRTGPNILGVISGSIGMYGTIKSFFSDKEQTRRHQETQRSHNETQRLLLWIIMFLLQSPQELQHQQQLQQAPEETEIFDDVLTIEDID